MQWHHGEYRVTDDKSNVDVDRVFDLLATSYWAAGRTKSTVKKTIEHSICFSVLFENRQVGFARVVTDKAVFAWIADVIIDPEHRGRGLGKFVMSCIQDHPEIPDSLQVLRTRDAHSLYEKFGFERGDFLSK